MQLTANDFELGHPAISAKQCPAVAHIGTPYPATHLGCSNSKDQVEIATFQWCLDGGKNVSEYVVHPIIYRTFIPSTMFGCQFEFGKSNYCFQKSCEQKVWLRNPLRFGTEPSNCSGQGTMQATTAVLPELLLSTP